MATAITPLGEVKGVELDGCERYAGIRYAKAPVGARRFMPPVPVDAWEGVYDATTFGPSAPQMPPFPGSVGVQRDLVTDEDCLYLNVYTPKADGGARPVMVWIHGGAYTLGSGDIYDGSSFARNGDVVVVTLNYRLGVLGFMALDHLDPGLAGSGNNGIRDQIEALRWVRANITAFGGDPGNVTIFGESAGGGSVAALLSAPDADGLYHKAIVESGALNFGLAASMHRYADEVVQAIGAVADPIAALRGATVEQLIDAQMSVGLIDRLGSGPDHPIDGTGHGPHPHVDGVVIPQSPLDTIRSKGARNVPLIIGSNLDEGTLFGLLLPQSVDPAAVVHAIGPSAPDPQAVVDAVVAQALGRPLLVDLMTDAVFRIPSLRAADAQAEAGVPVWVYLFTWPTPVFGGVLGATHALELPFVWDMLTDTNWQFLVGADAPTELAGAMRDAWINFARTGDPNGGDLPAWPTYDTATRPTFEFGEELRVVDDPGRVLRQAWYT